MACNVDRPKGPSWLESCGAAGPTHRLHFVRELYDRWDRRLRVGVATGGHTGVRQHVVVVGLRSGGHIPIHRWRWPHPNA